MASEVSVWQLCGVVCVCVVRRGWGPQCPVGCLSLGVPFAAQLGAKGCCCWLELGLVRVLPKAGVALAGGLQVPGCVSFCRTHASGELAVCAQQERMV